MAEASINMLHQQDDTLSISLIDGTQLIISPPLLGIKQQLLEYSFPTVVVKFSARGP
jgi:hypothetical protein